MRLIDLTGKRFGRLTVIRRHYRNDNSNKVVWECQCDCGNTCLVSQPNLGRGTYSCGCLNHESRVAVNTKHGMRYSRIYYIWTSMIQRCYNPKAGSYRLYGAKGVTVCDEWRRDAASFFAWAADNGYSDDLSIDRLDNSKGYSPDNCRWVTMKTQQNNRSTNKLLTHDGKTLTLSQWAETIGLNPRSLESRLVRGWPTEKALSTPLLKHYRSRPAKREVSTCQITPST